MVPFSKMSIDQKIGYLQDLMDFADNHFKEIRLRLDEIQSEIENDRLVEAGL